MDLKKDTMANATEVVTDSAEVVVAEVAAYRALCDPQAIGSRHLGLMDGHSITASLQDPTSVTVETNGVAVPAVVDIKYAVGAGYEPERCRAMAGDQDPQSASVLYYCLPPHEEGETVLPHGTLPDQGYMFFDHASEDAQTPANVEAFLRQDGYHVEEVPLEDEAAAEGNRQASISLYACDLPTANYEKRVTLTDVANAYEAGVANGTYTQETSGPRLLQGDKIDAELADKLWKLYEERFEWLSEKHPILSQDTKEGFLELLQSPDTLSSIYFENGEPTCFAYFTDNMDNIYWLSTDFFENKLDLQQEEKVLFWPGIVARTDGILGYSRPVIQLVNRVLADTEAPYKIVFENTNRSEAYIPALIKRYVDEMGPPMDEPTCVDRHMYRCFKFQKAPQESQE